MILIWNFSGKASPDESMEIAEDNLPVVRDLAKALLQISQMVFDKYLNPPLGFILLS